MAKTEFLACVEDESFDRNDRLNMGFLKVVEKAQCDEKKHTDFNSAYGKHELPKCLQYLLYVAYSLPYWYQKFGSHEEDTVQKANPILMKNASTI